MVLYLVRHGAAGEGDPDSERTLTSLGRREVEALRGELERQAVRADRVLHSGYCRARETAEILGPLCDSTPSAYPDLGPDGDTDTFIAELESFGGATMLVSHLPYLPQLCEALLEDVSSVPRFATATAVRLEPVGGSTGRRGWRLAWQINGRDVLLRS